MSEMERQDTVSNPTTMPRVANGNNLCSPDIRNYVYKKWHTVPLLSENPLFIEEIYEARGLTKTTVAKARSQMEQILQSRPTVKLMMKRGGLRTRTEKSSEEVKLVPAKSMPDLEPVPMESNLPDTITVYSGITDTPSVTRLKDLVTLPDINTGPMLSAANVSSAFRSIFEPESQVPPVPTCTKSNESVVSIAKKSTAHKTMRIQPVEMKSSYNIKECKILLYDFVKDYGNSTLYNEWKPSKGEGTFKEKKVKRKKNDATCKKNKNCNQASVKKLKMPDDLGKPVQTNCVPKVRFPLESKDQMGISSILEDEPFSNKENIMLDPVCSSDSTPRSTEILPQEKDKVDFTSYQSGKTSENRQDVSFSPTPHSRTESVNDSSTTNKSSPQPLSCDGSSTRPSSSQNNKNTTDSFSSVLKHKLVLPLSSKVSPKKFKSDSPKAASSTVAKNAEECSFQKKEVVVGTLPQFEKKSEKRNLEKSLRNSEYQFSPKETKVVLKFSSSTDKFHGGDPRRKFFLSTLVENNNNWVELKEVTSLTDDTSPTAELDLTSNKMHPLLIVPKENVQPQLKSVQWTTFNCLCDEKITFSDYIQWSQHCRHCRKIS